MPRDGYTTEEQKALSALGITERDLVEATRTPVVRVPRALDAHLRAAARKRTALIAARRPRVLRLRSFGGVAAVAATVLLALGVGLLATRDDTPRPSAQRMASSKQPRVSAEAPAPTAIPTSRPATTTPLARDRMDVDGNGTVNILDAFHLSRALDSDEAATGEFDFDGDGRTGLADVDAVAIAAVSL